MGFYYKLNGKKDASRIAERLLALREQIASEIPRRTVDDTLLLATWNIRDFDSNKFGHGKRLEESYYYIAEIISAFDLVALQEISDDLSALKRVISILGSRWSFIATDVTEGRSGNRERMAFVYDTRKVRFEHIAGEIVLPKPKKIDRTLQFARTPFFVAFGSHWFTFSLCAVHIYYGAASGGKLEQRIKEIDAISAFLAERAEKEHSNLILLGDFNILNPEHKTMAALERHGFHIPKEIRQPSNFMRDKHYDQIAFMLKKERLCLGDSRRNAGVLNYYESVFRTEEYAVYRERMKPKKRDFDPNGNPLSKEQKLHYYTHVWRTFQMSDHLPLWVELKIDFGKEYLESLTP